ncbi:MAG: hypothetical protein WEE89_14320 [Gemmatimonadota bacterium]
MADDNERSERAEGVLTQVCVNCGKEYYFDRNEPPTDQQCERCGNRVFRSFYSVTSDDEAAEDFQETTGRDVGTEDPATDVTAGDLHDLNNP